MSDDQVEESMEKLQQKAREKEHKTEEKGYWNQGERAQNCQTKLTFFI